MISYSGGTLYPPDGYRSGAGNPSLLTHAEADAFGLADVRAPGGALMGVFLDATVPAEGDALPTMLQYATPEQRNQLGQSPALRQPFYIGDGRTRDGQLQIGRASCRGRVFT